MVTFCTCNGKYFYKDKSGHWYQKQEINKDGNTIAMWEQNKNKTTNIHIDGPIGPDTEMVLNDIEKKNSAPLAAPSNITPSINNFGGKTIKDLPDVIDPIVILDKRMRTCPFCGIEVEVGKGYTDICHRDKKGKYHEIFDWLNKYKWKKYTNIECKKCGAKWDTIWFPADYSMFKITVK